MKKEEFSSIAPLTQATNHELVSHLGTIASQCERFLLGLEEGIYKGKSDKEIIKKATEIMRINLSTTSSAQKIIQGVSNYINSIRETSARDVDIRESINRALSSLRRDIKKAGIKIKKKFPPSLPRVNANPSEIQLLFFIIIDNAVEAIKEKGRGSIFINVVEKKEAISAEVKDTGCGMPQNVIKQIFEPFFSVRSHNGRKGLGLFIAHEIVYSLNGSITCESKLGRGSSFCLCFSKVKPTSSKASME